MEAGSILVIEDEQRLRANLQVLLSQEGYTVASAADGREGIQCLQNARFDLVITDIMMKGVNGFQVLEYIATHAPETLAIVITGYASTESVVEALRKGAYDYIAKPFEIEMIKIAIQRAMEKVRLQRELKRHTSELEHRVTERTRKLEEMNQKLNHSLAELKLAQEQLIQSEKLSALGELISGFAHELNNPLTSVLGYAEILAKSPDSPPDMRSMLDLLREEAIRCYQIVKNLLSFARKRKPEKKYIDVNSVCCNTLDLLAYLFKVNNITVEKHLDATLPRTMADEHQLQQVLVNVLTNAYQAMSEQRGRGHLTLTTAHDHESISIEIVDTGPGISAQNLRRIFDPFFTTKEHGTGLGLSLSYGIIKEHGGEILVTTTPGKGSSFTIVLGVTADGSETAKTYTTSMDRTCPAQRVLVVDDEQKTLQLLQTVLQFLGHRVEAVDSGQEALRRLERQNYDLIICDIIMPDIDGRQIYQFIEQHRPELMNGLIFSSGDTVSQEHRILLEETDRLFLHKPFLLEEIEQLIHQTSVRKVEVVE